MATSAFLQPNDASMPIELQMDLLVDGELSETQRAQLLRRLEANAGDASPAAGDWRALAIRFLQQQTEKNTVHALMAGGALVPVEVAQPPRAFKFPRWISPSAMMATAAGLLIAATSALLTLYMMRPHDGRPGDSVVVRAELPGEVVGYSKNVPISVDVVRRDGTDVNNVFPASTIAPAANGSRRSVVIQPDGRGNVVVFPVNTWKVY